MNAKTFAYSSTGASMQVLLKSQFISTQQQLQDCDEKLMTSLHINLLQVIE